MGVISLHRFETQPGRLSDHMAGTAEALGQLRGMGLQAAALNCVAGGDVGTVTTTINHESNAAYAAAMTKVNNDEDWMSLWFRLADGGAAKPVETSIFQDVDPGFQPDPNRPMGVVTATQWRAHPGRLMDFMGNVMDSLPHIERLGGTTRVLQSLIGAHPLTVLVPVGFADMEAYGAYSDAVATDEAFQAFWAGVMSDPTAELIRSGLYVNISGD